MGNFGKAVLAGIALLSLGSAAQARFLQVDPVGYKADVNPYVYVADDPTDDVDPTGMAGCDSGISQSQCGSLMGLQSDTLSDVKDARTALHQLKSDRADLKAGKIKSLSGADLATQGALRSKFGSSTDSVINAVDAHLGQVQTFLEDPGTAAGGKYDYRSGSGQEMVHGGANPATTIAYVNPAYQSNTVAVNWPVWNTQTYDSAKQTLVHEPLHIFGLTRPTHGELYFDKATHLATQPGGTTTAIYNNADNYACFVDPAGC